MSRYNSLETQFRSLVSSFAGLKGETASAVFTHIGAVTLIESFKALSNLPGVEDVVRDEVDFICRLFDVNRINRNFIAHNVQGAMLPQKGPHGEGVLMTKRTARGKVKVDQFLGTISAIRDTADAILDCWEYVAIVHGPLIQAEHVGEIELPHRPQLPDSLTLSLPKGALSDLIHMQVTPPQQ